MAVTAAACYVAADLYNYAATPLNENAAEKTIVIQSGQNIGSTALLLFENQIITAPHKFRMIARINGFDKKLKAGEYLLSAAMSPNQVLERLIRGKVLLHRVTVPEGYNLRQIAAVIAAEQLGSKDEFLAVATEASFIRESRIEGSSFEGYLFPDTYYFPSGVSGRTIIKTMLKRFWDVFRPEWNERARELGFSVHQIVTLASIIEKETGHPSERAVISSVFHNRLKKRMRLESDPTVIYGISDFDGNLTRRHLAQKTAYNTYRIRGLPPGPIANPGKAALRAALYPADTDYLYFVAKRDGTHKFSTNIRAHNRAVRKYQLKRR